MKYIAHGTQVLIGSTPIGGLISVGIPDRSRGEAETTDSDSGFDREFIAGLRDPGHVTLNMRHNPEDGGQQALIDNFEAPGGEELTQFQIILPAAAVAGSPAPSPGYTFSFEGYVSAPPAGDLALASDQAAELSATIRVTGPVTVSSF